MARCYRVIVLVMALSMTLCGLAQDEEASRVRNLGAAYQYLSHENWIAYSVWETFRGEDLNGDGDLEDEVILIENLVTGSRTNLDLAGALGWQWEGWFVVHVSEEDAGEDLDGDGVVASDNVIHLVEFSTARIVNLGLAGGVAWFSGDWLVVSVSENDAAEDLDGDGVIASDRALHVVEISTVRVTNLEFSGHVVDFVGDWLIVFRDMSGGWDQRELVLYDLSEGRPTAGCPVPGGGGSVPRLVGDRIILWVWEETMEDDLNGDGDLDDYVLHVHDLSTCETVNLGLTGNCCASDIFGPLTRLMGNSLVFPVREEPQGEDLNADGDLEDVVVHVHDLLTGETTNLERAIVWSWFGFGALSEETFVFSVHEREQGLDLNADGDREDRILHTYTFETGELSNLGIVGEWALAIDENWVVFAASEAERGEDINGDGELGVASSVHVADMGTGEVVIPTGAEFLGVFELDSYSRLLEEGRLLVNASEFLSGTDLNGDGDAEDEHVSVLYDLATGVSSPLGPTGSRYHGLLLIPGDWAMISVDDATGSSVRPLQLIDLVSGQQTDLGAYSVPYFYQGLRHFLRRGTGSHSPPKEIFFLARESDQGEDLNGDGDLEDDVWHLVDLTRFATPPRFIRGDCNADGVVDISDASCLLNWLFLGSAAPGCLAAANTNGDLAADISDASYLLNHLFLGGPPPAAPFPECGIVQGDVDCTIFPLNCR